MIDFKTKVELPLGGLHIGYMDRMMLFGSCFSENIGNQLVQSKFNCDVNPFGILYNPFSVSAALRDVLSGRLYTETDWELFECDGWWSSYMHHSRFSAETAADCLERINTRLAQASASFPLLNYLFITFGTARIYRLASNGCVVANCHKQPSRLFHRELLTVDEVVAEYKPLIEQMMTVNPALQIIFTVSPIRHAKDGMHGNQLSKAVLLLAVEKLCSIFPCCHYFPSYEIQLDELRDYRFYADDMLHPSQLAVAYIWECFKQCYFSKETLETEKLCREIGRGLEHRPFRPDSAQYKDFLSQIVLRIHRVIEKYPTLDFKNELELCHIRLNQSHT